MTIQRRRQFVTLALADDLRRIGQAEPTAAESFIVRGLSCAEFVIVADDDPRVGTVEAAEIR